MPEKKQVALVISGGGAKGAFAVGVLKHLFATYRDTGWFSIVGGNSTGALIAPMAALMAGPAPMRDEVRESLHFIYTNVSTPDILSKQGLLNLILRPDCFFRSGPLADLIRRRFKPEWFDWLQGPDAPDCYVVYVNYYTGQKATVSPKDEGMDRERFMTSMLASASVPVIVEAAFIDDDLCYDGGVRDLLPFGNAIKLGAEKIVPIYLDPEELSPPTDKLDRLDKILMRTLSIMVDETGRNDAELADLINIAVQARTELLKAFPPGSAEHHKVEAILTSEKYKPLLGPEKRLVEVVAGIRPDRVLIENSMTFDPVKMQQWVEWGAQKAAQIFQTSPFA